MVGFKSDFDSIIDDFGTYFALLRADKKQPCSCVDKLYMTAKSHCPICLETGYVTEIEKIKARMVIASIPETLPRALTRAQPGEIIVPAKQFFIKSTVRPKRNDYILVCEWNDNDEPIYDEYTEIFHISEVEPLRGGGGKLEYVIAYTQGDPLNLDIKLTNIKERGRVKTVTAVKGR